MPSVTPARWRRSARLVATVASSALLAAVLPLAGATSAEAASKHATSIALQSISSPSATGAKVLSGDKIVLRGTASKNLVGKTLHVDLKKGKTWIRYAGAGKVSASRSFSISSRATGVGKQSYRVSFASTRTLKASNGAKSVTVWKWFPLVDQPVASAVEPLGGDYPHATNQLSVAGVNYSRLLAGISYANETSSSDFNLGYHCSAFSTIVGLADKSASGTTETFTVYLDGNQAAQAANLAVGKTSNFDLDVSGIFRIRLEHAGLIPNRSISRAVFPAWPTAKVLCSADI